jgi:uncharacterized protein (TIGR00730 family)
MSLDPSKTEGKDPKPRPVLSREKLIAEMLQTVNKLATDDVSRGELKLLNRALKELRYAFKVFAPYRTVRKVSFFGSSRVVETDPYYQMAAELGRRLVREKYMIITGAGEGIMQAGHEGAGREQSFGVNIRLPFVQEANRFIGTDPKLVTFRYFFTRKLVFVKEVDAFVFFPGGYGTHDEVLEILTLAQTGKSQIVPILLMDLPGRNYWRDWERFVRSRMLEAGYVSEHDLWLFKIVEDVSSAAEEIRKFYRNYHSYRYVNGSLVMRLLHPPRASLIERLNREFQDILLDGAIRPSEALPEEADEPEFLHLPRLLIPFNRRDFGRLRLLIDAINENV